MRGMINGDITQLQRDAFGLDDGNAGVDNRADQGADSFSQEFSLELMRLDASNLSEVEEALVRTEDGSYGRCLSCEKWIISARLRAMPHARHCVECQRSIEQSA